MLWWDFLPLVISVTKRYFPNFYLKFLARKIGLKTNDNVRKSAELQYQKTSEKMKICFAKLYKKAKTAIFPDNITWMTIHPIDHASVFSCLSWPHTWLANPLRTPHFSQQAWVKWEDPVICEISPLVSYSGESLEPLVAGRRFVPPLLLNGPSSGDQPTTNGRWGRDLDTELTTVAWLASWRRAWEEVRSTVKVRRGPVNYDIKVVWCHGIGGKGGWQEDCDVRCWGSALFL